MAERFDFKTIRVFPYFLLAIFVTSLANVITVCLAAVMDSGSKLEGPLQSTSGILLTTDILKYASVVAIFVCLYRIHGVTRWFLVANSMFVGYMVADIMDRILWWVCAISGNYPMVANVAYVSDITTDIFILLGVCFVLRGIARLYDQMDRPKAAESVRTSRELWIFAEIISLLISILLIPVEYVVTGSARVVTMVVLGICVFFYLFVVAFVFFKARNFCYDYYMYMYNKGHTR